jgi:acetyl-CoA carboxylase biotin carboxyl carrier protein
MNIKEIKELVRILDGTDIVEFSFENEGSKISIKKGLDNVQYITSHTPAHVPAAVIPLAPVPAVVSPAAETGEELGANQVYITAPMVGTFYKAASPEVEPYVQVGDMVDTGQVVCIIEAMKLMNEIESEYHGKIVEVLVSNAQPVEFGQPLYIVEKI